MAYVSSCGDHQYLVETTANGPQHQVTIDGIPHEIDWRQIAPLAADEGGRYTLLIEGHSYEIFARRLESPDEQEGAAYEILLAGRRYEVHVADERERALRGSLKSSHATGEIKVRAPMPGLVLAILKSAGETVERGATVAVLEAMKMENDLTTPHGGTIKEVLVSKGQTVNQGDILLVIAAD